MRELKFRAWDKIAKQMLLDVQDHRIRKWSFASLIKDSNFILMQFTGLLDCNNKEIYEGDIVKIKNRPLIGGEVKYFHGSFVIGKCNENRALIKNYSKNLIEVVGNIYQEPRMLNDTPTKKKEKTCARCRYLIKFTTQGLGASVAGCKKTKLVVPHEAIYDAGGDSKATFWRIPKECPRKDVLKSKNKAPKRDWITIPISQIPEAK